MPIDGRKEREKPMSVLTGSKAMIKPEEKVLVLLARQDINENSIKILKNIVDRGLNYDYLKTLAQNHQVAPIIGYHLAHNTLIKNHISFPDSEFVKTMVFANLSTQAHNRRMYTELDHLQRLFSEHDIQFVALKGPGMAKFVYAKCVGGRLFGDLDLLIAPDDIKKAHELLISDGYKAYDVLGQLVTDLQIINQLKTAHLLAYTKDLFTVELHQYNGEYEIDLSRLFSNAKPVRLNKEMVLIPDEIDFFIHSCAHLESHIHILLTKTPIPLQPCPQRNLRQVNLKQLMDIRESYLSLQDKKEKIAERIEEFGVNDIVSRALLITERIYGEFSTLKLKQDKGFDCYYWRAENWESPIERRLLCYSEEQKRIIEKSREAAKKKRIFKCFHKMHSRVLKHKNVYNMPSIYVDKKYIKYLLEKTENQYPVEHLHPQFSMSWDEQNFYFTQKINIDKLPDKKQAYQFGYQLLFGFNRDEFVKVIFIKPLESGNHEAFMWQQEYTEGTYIPLKISTEYNSNSFFVRVALLWSYLNFTPEANKVVFFDSTIRTAKASLYHEEHILSWSTGKYYLQPWMDKCDYFNMNLIQLCAKT